MLVDGKQKIAHFALFVHHHLFISPLLIVSPEIAWKPPFDRLKQTLAGTRASVQCKKREIIYKNAIQFSYKH